MKLLKFALIGLYLAVAALRLPTTHAQGIEEPKIFTEKLESDFLGVHLGCSLEELQALLRKSAKSMKLIKKGVMNGRPSYMFSGNHRLNGATATGFGFWEGKLSIVIVFFRTEEPDKVYDALKMKMEEKYGKMTNEIEFAGKRCALIKDGMMFNLQYETNPFKTDTVMLICEHLGIKAAEEAKAVEKKARELGDF